MGKDDFSIDDILNEYPKNGARSSKPVSFDLDELLAPKPAEKTVPVKTVRREEPTGTANAAKSENGGLPHFTGEFAAHDPEKERRRAERITPVSVRTSEIPRPVLQNPEKKAFEASLQESAPAKPIEPKRVYPTAEINRIGTQNGNAVVKTSGGEKPFEPKKSMPKPSEGSATEMTENRPTMQSADGLRLSDEMSSQSSVNTVSAEDRNKKSESSEKISQKQTQQSEEPQPKQWEPSKRSKGTKRTELAVGQTQMYEELSRERPAKPLPPVERKKVEDVELNIQHKVKPFTGQLEIDENATEEEKRRALEERRKRKISQFIIDKEEAPAAKAAEQKKETEFVRFEDAPRIAAEISEIRATMFIRLIVLLVLGVISVYASCAKDYNFNIIGFNGETQQTSYTILQVALCVLAIFVSYSAIASGVKKLFTFNADADSLTAVICISSLIASVMFGFRNYTLINGLSHIYVNVAIILLLFNTIGKLLIIGRVKRNFSFVTGDNERHAIVFVGNEERAGQITRGLLTDIPALSTMRRTEFLSDFNKHSYSSDITDKFCKLAVPLGIAFSLVVAAVSFFLCDVVNDDRIYIAISVFTLCLGSMAGFGLPMIINMPLNDASKKMVESSGALLGYQGVDDFADTNSIMLDASRLFPQGTINLHAIKVFSDTKIDEAIIEAASLTSHADSILKHMFYDVIVGKTEMLSSVENYVYEDSMGLCGWIDNRRILLGNRELMMNHSIEGIPSKAKEKEYTDKNKSAVYLSVSGNLAALFIVEINASLEVKKWMRRLCREDVGIVLRCVDSVLSVAKISELFDVPEDMLKIMPFRMHNLFEEETDYVPKLSSGLVCSGRFSSMASLILSTKHIRKTALIGMVVQASGVILGLILSLLFVIMGKFSEVSATMLLVYNLIWTVLTYLVLTLRKR